VSRAFVVNPELSGSDSPVGKGRRLVLEALWMLCPSLAATALLLLCLQLPWEPQPSEIRPAAPLLVQPADADAAQPGKALERAPARQKSVWRA
jgi:hypothetical protein